MLAANIILACLSAVFELWHDHSGFNLTIKNESEYKRFLIKAVLGSSLTCCAQSQQPDKQAALDMAATNH